MNTPQEQYQYPSWPPADPRAAAPGPYPVGEATATFDPPFTAPAPVADLGEPTGNVAGPPDDPGQPAGTEDIGTILPRPDLITLASGRQVQVRKLKSRELFALVGIAVSGVGGQLDNLRLDPDEPAVAFVAKFSGLILASAFTREGSEQVFAFLRMVCEPVGKVTEGKIDKAVKARNDALDKALSAELDNPEPDDTITIVEAIARNNAGDLQHWGKRLAGIWNLAVKTGQIPASLTSQG